WFAGGQATGCWPSRQPAAAARPQSCARWRRCKGAGWQSVCRRIEPEVLCFMWGQLDALLAAWADRQHDTLQPVWAALQEGQGVLCQVQLRAYKDRDCHWWCHRVQAVSVAYSHASFGCHTQCRDYAAVKDPAFWIRWYHTGSLGFPPGHSACFSFTTAAARAATSEEACTIQQQSSWTL
ncbi:hypothetical protein LPJ73_006050, partial [Coemansia sp. RSA 2703]